ncbi:MAG TPA: sigma-54 dependent transcriptional regulator [Candidatus Angelobacter sp.]|nr:sigma-54 dependent transcriptional regulator [Candidatus Angelobacter sp.]
MPGASQAISTNEQFFPSPISVLVVDEDRFAREACRQLAEQLGCTAFLADSAGSALRHLGLHSIHLVLVDARLVTSPGDVLLRSIKAQPRGPKVVLLKAQYSSAPMLSLLERTDGVLQKPVRREDFRKVVEQVAANLRQERAEAVTRNLSTESGFHGLIGESEQMRKLYRIVAKVGPSRHPVLMIGERGTGKEKLARAIHSCGQAQDAPFIAVDCAGSSSASLEAELFGTAQGKPQNGRLLLANGGTIFIDAIAEMPLDVQGKLLRALQEKEIRPVGSIRGVPIEVRVIGSTDRELDSAVQQGSFRRDLYLRLNVVSLHLPALRERREDIPLLAEHLLSQISAGRTPGYSLSPAALKVLTGYDWPGNIRELENCLQRAAAMSSSPVLESTHFLPLLQRENFITGQKSLAGRILPLAEVEKQAILGTLEQLNGDKLMTARVLGIGKTTLYRKLKEYGFWGDWMNSPSAGK